MPPRVGPASFPSCFKQLCRNGWPNDNHSGKMHRLGVEGNESAEILGRVGGFRLGRIPTGAALVGVISRGAVKGGLHPCCKHTRPLGRVK